MIEYNKTDIGRRVIYRPAASSSETKSGFLMGRIGRGDSCRLVVQLDGSATTCNLGADKLEFADFR